MWPHVLVVSLALIALEPDGPGREEHPIAPDPETQQRIDRAVRAILRPDLSVAAELIEVENQLRELREQDASKLVQQILRYHNVAHEDDEPRALTAMVLIRYFDIPETSIVRAVVPYIDADNRLLRTEVRRLLRHVEGSSSVMVREPDYSYYRGCIEAAKENPPSQLVRYMYDRSPGTALRTLLRIYMYDQDMRFTERSRKLFKEVLWSEHLVADVLWKQRYDFLDKNEVPAEAAAEVEKLSKHKAWWARLYVAEILRQHPQFRTAELIDRLKADEHELVRRAIVAIDNKPGSARSAAPLPSSKCD